MTDYHASTEVDANAEAVFDFLSDVRNLPRYFDRMTSAEPGDGEEVAVTAQLGERTVEGKAWFRVSQEDRVLEWGSEGPNDYRGRLSVNERGMATAVAVDLSTARNAGPEIQEGLERTVQTIRSLVQADPG